MSLATDILRSIAAAMTGYLGPLRPLAPEPETVSSAGPSPLQTFRNRLETGIRLQQETLDRVSLPEVKDEKPQLRLPKLRVPVLIPPAVSPQRRRQLEALPPEPDIDLGPPALPKPVNPGVLERFYLRTSPLRSFNQDVETDQSRTVVIKAQNFYRLLEAHYFALLTDDRGDFLVDKCPDEMEACKEYRAIGVVINKGPNRGHAGTVILDMPERSAGQRTAAAFTLNVKGWPGLKWQRLRSAPSVPAVLFYDS